MFLSPLHCICFPYFNRDHVLRIQGYLHLIDKHSVTSFIKFEWEPQLKVPQILPNEFFINWYLLTCLFIVTCLFILYVFVSILIIFSLGSCKYVKILCLRRYGYTYLCFFFHKWSGSQVYKCFRITPISLKTHVTVNIIKENYSTFP